MGCTEDPCETCRPSAEMLQAAADIGAAIAAYAPDAGFDRLHGSRDLTWGCPTCGSLSGVRCAPPEVASTSHGSTPAETGGAWCGSCGHATFHNGEQCTLCGHVTERGSHTALCDRLTGHRGPCDKPLAPPSVTADLRAAVERLLLVGDSAMHFIIRGFRSDGLHDELATALADVRRLMGDAR
jgi:hypothetical protein